MTTAQRNIYNATNLKLPDIDKFLNSILDSLKDHGGKASRDQVTSEAESMIRDRYNLLSASPAINLAIRKRLDRSLELLSNADLVAKKGLHSISLTSRALIVSKEELQSIARETQLKSKIERHIVLPLPDEIAEKIVSELRTAQLTALEIEEHLLRQYTNTNAILSVDQAGLDELRRRTITARRVLEGRHLIELDSHGLYTLTTRGRAASPKQVGRITRLSAGVYLRHELLKLRLLLERHAEANVRQSITQWLFKLVAGLIYRTAVQDHNKVQFVGTQYRPVACEPLAAVGKEEEK